MKIAMGADITPGAEGVGAVVVFIDGVIAGDFSEIAFAFGIAIGF